MHKVEKLQIALFILIIIYFYVFRQADFERWPKRTTAVSVSTTDRPQGDICVRSTQAMIGRSASIICRRCNKKKQGLSPCAVNPPPSSLCDIVSQSATVSILYAHFVVLGLVTLNSKSAHLLRLPRDQWYRRYKIHQDSIHFRTCPVILALKPII